MDLAVFRAHVEAGRLPKQFDGNADSLNAQEQELLISLTSTEAAPDGALSLLKVTSVAPVVAVKAEGDEDALEFDFTITTDDVDRDRDTIAVDGWQFDNYLTNPVVLFAHDYGSPPIARTVKLTKHQHRIDARCRFTNPGVYPFADMIRGLVRDEFMRACSVGFKPITWNYNEERRGIDFLSQELLEFSLCPVPANPYAVRRAMEAGHHVELLTDWAKQVLASSQPELPVPSDTPALMDVTALVKAITPALREVIKTELALPTADLIQGETLISVGNPVWAKQLLTTRTFAKVARLIKQVDTVELQAALTEALDDVMACISCAADVMDELKYGLLLLQGSETPANEDEGEEVIDLAWPARRRKGVVPADVSTDTADMDTDWAAPSLAAFGGDSWSDLPEDERRHIAGYFAWSRTMPPEVYGDLKLAHHRASDGKVVWNGVRNAAARLPQTQMPQADMVSVRRHLGRHYHAFGKTPPWEAQSETWAEYEQVCRALTDDPTDMTQARSYCALYTLLFPADEPAPEYVELDLTPEEETPETDLIELDLDEPDADDSVELDFDPSELPDLVAGALGQALMPLTGRLD